MHCLRPLASAAPGWPRPVLSCRRACAPRLSPFSQNSLSSPGGAFLAGAATSPQLRGTNRCLPAVRHRDAAVPVRAAAVTWVAAAAAVGGLLLGLLLAKAAQSFFSAPEFDPKQTTLENAQLRAKVEELQQMVSKFEPMAYKSMRLRFTKGVNKAVILALVDDLLARKEVNIWWLPDSIERIFYFNVISLILSVLDQVVEGMSMNFAGHNVRLQLTYLDMQQDTEEAAGAAAGGDGQPVNDTLLPAT